MIALGRRRLVVLSSHLHALAQGAPFRFAVVGVGNTAVGLSVIYAVKWFANLGDAAANIIGYACGLTLSFVLNKKWSFGHQGAVLPAMLKFLGVFAVAYPINLCAALFMIERLGVNSYLAHALAIVPYSVVSFLGSRYVAFAQSSAAGRYSTAARIGFPADGEGSRADNGIVGRPIVLVCAAAIVGSLVLAGTYYRYVPLLQDGGWYTYPAYAIAEGGDASENLPGYVLDPLPSRVSAKFRWENRSNLTVPMTAGWFELVGASWQSLRLLGAIQVVALALLAALTVRRWSGSGALTIVAGALALSDSVLIASAVSNGRPDVTIAVWAMATVYTLTRFVVDGSRKFFVLTLLLACTLPLLHVTSAIAVSAISVFSILLASRRVGVAWTPGRRSELLTIAVLPVLMFLVRQSIMDWMIPTAVSHAIEATGQHSLLGKLQANFTGGLQAKAAMEWPRWKNYFVIANLFHLMLIFVGVAATSRNSRPSKRANASVGFSQPLFIALAVASCVQLLTDPHGTSGHLIVLAQLAYVASLGAVGESVRIGEVWARRLAPTLLALIAGATVLKFGHAYRLYTTFGSAGLSNALIQNALYAAMPAGAEVRVVGPAEMWPYLSRRHQPIVIVDVDRSIVPVLPNGPDFAGARFLAVNEDYWNFGWSEVVPVWRHQGLIEPVFTFGECGRTVACLDLYRIVDPLPELR